MLEPSTCFRRLLNIIRDTHVLPPQEQDGCCGALAEDGERIMVNTTQQGGKRAGEARDAVLTRAFGVGAMDYRPPCGCGDGACLHPGLTSRMLSLAPTSVVAALVVGLSLLAPAVQAYEHGHQSFGKYYLLRCR